jgi:hypothetical protein
VRLPIKKTLLTFAIAWTPSGRSPSPQSARRTPRT